MKIVFFDGYCSLCSALVDWLIRIDKSHQLKFASLQGETATKLLGHQHEDVELNSVVYLRDGSKFEQSTAVLNILSDVGGVWRITRLFWIAPKFFRDFIYLAVAMNRFRFIKKRDTCRIPTPEELGRLLP